jgi:hypothetical protein
MDKLLKFNYSEKYFKLVIKFYLHLILLII